ncbi:MULTISPECIES: YbaN family protein [Pasteurellaceae]|uniref:Inner membrane protein n=1 Tax=Pasteurella bettyae CCUG 2042 TaxID=1095749 RepID=I3D6U8_9PAST|nr:MULTISPECIES: YbaN family protein [Pasteurellaceae]EIJ67441.1 PF04304 family protein [Pasteurella bettyae CCUG 2042]SUB21844.1 putative transmembrane protein [Pasteurella bettyae]
MKLIFALLGFIFLGLGIAGIILPLMPGTPFLLLALFFFARSSDRLHQWFLQTEIYNKHLKSLNEQRALTKKSKFWILFIVTIMLAIGFYFTPSVVGRTIIASILMIKYFVFFFYIKTIEE